MTTGSPIKVTFYIFIVITLIHIIVSAAAPVQRCGFRFAPLPETAGHDATGAAPFPTPVYAADPRAGAPVNLGFFHFDDVHANESFSPWYESKGDFYVMTGGFPFLDGNRLFFEVQSKNGMTKRLDITDGENTEVLVLRKLSLKSALNPAECPCKIRIAAKRTASGNKNTWFAVSEPFIITDKSGQLMSVLRIILSVFAAMTLIFGPGLAMRTYLRDDSLLRAAAFIPLPGILISATCGLVCWRAAPQISPQIISTAFALISLFFCAYVLETRGSIVSKAQWKLFGIVFVVILIATARGSYSVGPYGEMYGHTISRTLDAGGRPDSRIQYHVVQLVGNGLKPYSTAGSKYFYPWSFSSRTPLGGLAAAPLVFLAGGRPPLEMPLQAWSPFDCEGFAVYRIAMIVMASACLFGMFSAALALAGEAAAVFSVLLMSMTPFFIHEVYYSWPKLAAAGLVMTALYTVIARGPRLAGLCLGLGYLYHPMVVFAIPVILFVWIAVEGSGSLRELLTKRYRKMLLDGGIIVVTCGLFMILWQIANGDANRQSYFLQYILMSNAKLGAGLPAWLMSRVRSLANTLVPLYLYCFTGDAEQINSLHGRVPGIIPFCFQYCNTVPFGLGLTALVIYIKKIYSGARCHPIVFSVLILIPFFAFAVYWGYNITGLMPEGLHVWVMCVISFMVWTWKPQGFTKSQSIVLSLRGIEVIIMLIAPVWFSQAVWLDEVYYMNDIIMLAVMFGGTAMLVRKTLAIAS